MKNRILALFVLMMTVVVLSSCTAVFPKKENIVTLSGEEATKILKGKTEKEIIDNWGEPDGTLSGFYGDIFVCNDKSIVVYFNAEGKVSDVLVSDKQNYYYTPVYSDSRKNTQTEVYG